MTVGLKIDLGLNGKEPRGARYMSGPALLLVEWINRSYIFENDVWKYSPHFGMELESSRHGTFRPGPHANQ